MMTKARSTQDTEFSTIYKGMSSVYIPCANPADPGQHLLIGSEVASRDTMSVDVH